MTSTNVQSLAWELVRRQHGVIARRQLLAIGFTRRGIEHRIRKGRLHPIHPGVYAVGRPELTQHGRWMAAILAKGPAAVLSHRSAASMYGIAKQQANAIHVAVPTRSRRRSSRDITVHRRSELSATTKHGVPVTTIEDTLIDLATELSSDALDQAINEADKRDLIDPEALHEVVEEMRRPGAAAIRKVTQGFVRTDSPLERQFLKIARAAGLPSPQTQAHVNGHRVDFFWPELKLVVETDGLRYHRTPAQQAADRRRDQDHGKPSRGCLNAAAMRLFALRGAITVDHNDAEEILGATERLVRGLLERNGLDPEAIVSCIFTATEDLDAEFPAVAARRVGLTHTPLLCARELPVPGALPRVIRVLVHYYAEEGHSPQHVYLGEARALRADLDHAQ
jgi:chorismate mutase